jgi:hypothetical protein
MAVTEPDPAPFRAAMGPAIEEIEAYAGAGNVATFARYVEEARGAGN